MTEQTPKRILVIDDDVDYRTLMVRLLQKSFPKVKVANLDPLKKGLPGASFDWGQFDVVIIDYNLGKAGSGLECVRNIRKQSKHPPATILLTAEGNEDVAAKAFRHGVHDYRRKQGLTADVLIKSIRAAFKVRGSQVNQDREVSLNATQFSRTFFYDQVNLAREEAAQGKSRALLLVRPVNREELEKSIGLLAMDEITRYLAKLTVRILRVSRYPVRSTRFGEASIAVIAGDFDEANTLQNVIRNFFAEIEKNPPEFEGNKIPLSTNIGAVEILSEDLQTRELLALAEQACQAAASTGHSPFQIVAGAAPKQAFEKNVSKVAPFDIISAIKESRIQPMFYPLMPVSENSAKFEKVDIFQINPYVVDHDGRSMAVSEVLDSSIDDNSKKIIDRWTLREAEKRLAGPITGTMPGFVVALSAPSLVDKDFPVWTEKLLAHFGQKKNMAFFALKIDPDTLMRNPKIVAGVCIKLRQRLGFRISLGEVSTAAVAKACLAQMPIDFVQIATHVVCPDKPTKEFEEECAKLMELVEAKNALSIVCRIDDVNSLHTAISAGADFVQGNFVAPEQLEVEASASVESVSL